MPNSKSHRRGTDQEKNRKGKLLSEKSSSFHGRNPVTMAVPQLRRPNTVPDLNAGRNLAGISSPEERPRLTKLLLNVTIRGSVGPVQVLMTPESSVGDLISAAVRQYVKEGRRAVLPTTDSVGFDLHYSQFSLESLNREEKLMALGSRNFYLCPKRDGNGSPKSSSSSSSSTCSKQAEKVDKISLPWLRFMDFLL